MGASPAVRWEEVERLIDEALALAPDDRGGFLEQNRSIDPALAAEVERLLRAIDESGDFLVESGPEYAAPLLAQVAEQDRILPGQRIGGYEVVRELGQGGMATVYLAHDLRHDRKVAVKVVHPELSRGFRTEQFLAEIRTMARLQHPHILPLHDSGEVDGLLFYVMPYIEGDTLRQRIDRDTRLEPDEVVRITRDVAGALDSAHRHGVIHRDIKPENILLAEGGALVADFGIALAISAASARGPSQPGWIAGTPRYMSPEQVEGGALDGRSDLYALGVVTFEMLTGQPPSAGATVTAILAGRAEVAPPPSLRALRTGIPPAVDAVVAQALARRPEDRHPSGGEFAEALQRSLAVRRFSRTAVIATAVLLLSGAVTGRMYYKRHQLAALDPKRVVIAPFADHTGDVALSRLGVLLADRLASGMTDIQLVQVVDAGGAEAKVREAAAQGSGGARALAEGLGAGSVLWGSYYRRGDSIEFEAQLTDTRSGRIAEPIVSAAAPVSDPTAAVELLRQHAMAAAAWHFAPWIEELENSSRPSNYEAFREFSAADGVGQASWNCRFAECGYDHWRRAYALDTNFVLPLILIAGRGDTPGGCRLTDSIAEALRPRHDLLPGHDRAALDAAVAGCHGERRLQLTAAEEAFQAGGKSVGDALDLGELYTANGFFRDAVAILTPLDSATAAAQLVITYHLLGEYEKALVWAQAAHRADPDNLVTLSCQARANVGLGRLAKVEEALEAMLKASTNAEKRGVTQALAFSWVARDLDAHGYSAQARDVYERALAWCRSRPREEQEKDQKTYALVLYQAGHWEKARAVVQHIIATAAPSDSGDPLIWFRGAQSLLGGIAAHLGDQREMDRVDQWLASRKGPYLIGVPTLDRARMAAIRGDRERAMTLIRLAVDQGYPPYLQDLGLHDDPDFKSLWGYPPFEEFRKPKESPGGS